MLRSRKPHSAGVGRKLAADDVEAGRLARAVRPDQRQHLAGGDIEADIVDCMHAAERLGELAHGEKAHARLRFAHKPVGERAGDAAREMPAPGARITRPRSARQKVVWRMTVSCSQVKIAAPTIGPLNVWTPPSSTMTMPSSERETAERIGRDRALGEREQRSGQRRRTFAGDGKADPMHALDVDADRLGPQRRVAARAQRVAERRKQDPAQQQHAGDREGKCQQIITRSGSRMAVAARCRECRWSRR